MIFYLTRPALEIWWKFLRWRYNEDRKQVISTGPVLWGCSVKDPFRRDSRSRWNLNWGWAQTPAEYSED
jgi:hypothetical protein